MTPYTGAGLYTGINEADFGFPQLPGRTDAEYKAFEDAFLELSGIHLALYKEKQMRRRINTLMDRKNIDTYQGFISRLSSQQHELADFIDYITINVTEFFRTPEHWTAFEKELTEQLFPKAHRPLRIWSCACSTGEEVYSLAMSMLKFLPPDDFHIIATDLDEKVLNCARDGVYSDQAVMTLPEELRNQYFIRQSKGWMAGERLRSCIGFRKLDILCDEYPPACDLIVCRNILIYFTDEAKDSIYAKFHHSLTPGGYLFTGNAEQIVYYKKYGFQKARSFLYKKS